jgi:hypothetical protein
MQNIIMKKLMLVALLIYGVSCSNPEDQATGNPDSSSFNADENKEFNTPADYQNLDGSADTSAAPALDKKNADSKTSGTNRPYTPGHDSTP